MSGEIAAAFSLRGSTSSRPYGDVSVGLQQGVGPGEAAINAAMHPAVRVPFLRDAPGASE